MMESKVFADNFSRSFSESGDFFQFLSARQAPVGAIVYRIVKIER